VLVRYADDLVVCCHTKREAEAALMSLRSILAELGLELKAAKTRIVHLCEGGEGLVFLGFDHPRVRGERGYRHLRFLARWPSREAMQRARDRIREITNSKRLRDPVDVIVQDLNRFLRGWAGYFRYGNSRLHFTRITTYALKRLALFVAKRHQRASGYGMTVVAFVSPNRMGLLSLDRLVVTPSPSRDWRAKPNTGGEGRR
jgi:RNA-directed DNA polymerase